MTRTHRRIDPAILFLIIPNITMDDIYKMDPESTYTLIEETKKEYLALTPDQEGFTFLCNNQKTNNELPRTLAITAVKYKLPIFKITKPFIPKRLRETETNQKLFEHYEGIMVKEGLQ